MNQLSVTIGSAARPAICDAIAQARSSIDAAFHIVSDPAVIKALNAAAARHVRVCLHVEACPDRYDPHRTHDPSHAPPPDRWVADSLRRQFSPAVDLVLEDNKEMLHTKAMVVDSSIAYLSTGNVSLTGLDDPREVLVTDSAPPDVAAVQASIERTAGIAAGRIVAGPSHAVRAAVNRVLDSRADVRIASEDFSDREIVDKLLERKAAGHHDRVLIAKADSPKQRWSESRLANAHVEIRWLPRDRMHEKYVDGGDEVYLGSANLTRNGLDEEFDLGVVAPAASFGGVAALRERFDDDWERAKRHAQRRGGQ